MKKVMLRSTGEVFQAEKTNKGANIYRLNGEFVREFAESTFKRYFKPVDLNITFFMIEILLL